jgi:hypothetical protein
VGELKQEQEVRWLDLPREQRRRLIVLVGKLVRQHLAAAPNSEADDERDDAHPHSLVTQ